MIEFNTVDEKLPEIKIDGEIFEVKPMGSRLLFDMYEINKLANESGDGTGDETKNIESIKQIYTQLESMLIAKGKLTVKEVFDRLPPNKIAKLVEILVKL